MKIKQIIFPAVNEAALVEKEAELGRDQVCVRTAFSTISSGTERAHITGDLNTNAYHPLEEPDFPREAGYSSSGIVTAVGEDVKDLKVGDRVAVFFGLPQGL